MAKTGLVTPELESYLDDHGHHLVATLQQLIQIPTVNPPGECYADCARLLKEKLTACGLRAEVVHARDGKPNVLGFLDHQADRTLHFNAHYDVVPAGSGWSYDPFVGTVAEGNLYGRGSADMKGAIASLLHALMALRVCRVKPRVNVEVSFVCDEETGGADGAGWLVREVPLQADAVVVCEGASNHLLGLGHNGVIWLEARLHGKAAHASRPQDGTNAFEDMTRLVAPLTQLRTHLESRRFPRAGGESVRATLNLGGTFGQNGGSAVNIIPSEAWFTLDRRVLPSEELLRVEEELTAALHVGASHMQGSRLELRNLLRVEPHYTEPSHPLAVALGGTIQRITGKQAEPHVTSGFTDARFFARDGKLPTVMYGPSGSRYHGADEFAPVESLRRTAKVYASLIEAGLGAAG